jgi:sugar phosphate isomerase/epimerase
VSDVKGILEEYKTQGFEGPISIEYEHNWEHSVDDARICIDFMRVWDEK